MEARELRIGSWVNSEEYGDYQIVALAILSEDNCSAFKCTGCCPKASKVKELNPILITKEWLLRFGFKYTPCGISGADMWQGMGFWELNNDSIYLTLRGQKNPKYGLKLSGYFNSEYLYVHQLQNLYFTLTGKELTIQNYDD
jgi:hypothetical protein